MDTTVISGIAEALHFEIPPGFFFVHERNLTNVDPWFFLGNDRILYLYETINRSYPDRRVLPFARSGASDDVACFVIAEASRSQGEIVIIHEGASRGVEVEARLQSFWDWFKSAIDGMISWFEAQQAAGEQPP